MKKAFAILLLLLSCFAKAQNVPVYNLNPLRQLHDLKGYAFLLVDSLQAFTPADVVAGKRDDAFIPYHLVTPTSANSKTYWLRFAVRSDSAVAGFQLLLRDTLEYSGYTSRNDSVTVYFVNAERKWFGEQSTGVMVARSRKVLPEPAGMNAVPLSLPVGTQTVYVRVKKLFPDAPYFSYPVVQEAALPKPTPPFAGTLYTLNAIALLFFALSVFFFVFIRERSYLFFSIYTLVLSQHYLILHPDLPFISRYIPEHPQWIHGFWNLLTSGSILAFCVFGRSFINLRRLSPKTDVWFLRYIVAYGVLTLVQTVWLMAFRKTFFPPPLLYAAFLVALGFFVRFWFFKTVLAKLLVGGAVWLLAFTVLGLLWTTGNIALPFNPWPVAQVGQLLIYAAALAYKVRLNEKARAEAVRIKDMDDIKSRFFANISHEFRTPLTLIQGPLQQIEEETKAKEGTVAVPMRHVKTMRRNTDRLLELVNQLLDLSKLDSGKMDLQIIKGDVGQLLKAITASFDSMAERKSIHYRVQFPESTAIAFFDKDKLEKIVSNLLSNAFKYTPEGGTVSVSVETEEGRLRFSVEDNGPGIPKKELDKIFDRFYQLEGTEDKGSGIGLALVKELVHLYRGQISVSSEPGKGSRFKVSLPVEKESFREEELVYGEWKGEESFINRNIEEKEISPQAKEVANAQLPLLLIVEDNADLRGFIRETVQGRFQVLEAANGKEGLEKALAEVPDIIVSDVMMPAMDGFALTEKLKKDERTSHIPVILLTAKAGQQHKLEGLQTGADDYLAKPFDAKELVARLQNLIVGRKLLRKKFAGEILFRPSEIAATSMDETFLTKVMQAVEQNLGEEDFGVEELAREVAMSRSQLHRKLAALTGQSPSEVLRTTRLLRAKELLQKKAATPSEVAFQVGFNSHTYFSKCFKEEFGVSPSEVRE